MFQVLILVYYILIITSLYYSIKLSHRQLNNYNNYDFKIEANKKDKKKKEIKDKESLQTINKNPPFDAFSSTNC